MRRKGGAAKAAAEEGGVIVENLLSWNLCVCTSPTLCVCTSSSPTPSPVSLKLSLNPPLIHSRSGRGYKGRYKGGGHVVARARESVDRHSVSSPAPACSVNLGGCSLCVSCCSASECEVRGKCCWR